MPGELIDVHWSLRRAPLEVRGVVARGQVARALADRVIQGEEPWRGVVGPDLIVLLGDELPWVDGVTYLGHEPAEPGLWFDTRLQPNVPVPWLASRVAREGPIAWLQHPELLVPLREAAPFHRPALQAWRNR